MQAEEGVFVLGVAGLPPRLDRHVRVFPPSFRSAEYTRNEHPLALPFCRSAPFVGDSPLERDEFEPSVPLKINDAFERPFSPPGTSRSTGEARSREGARVRIRFPPSASLSHQ